MNNMSCSFKKEDVHYIHYVPVKYILFLPVMKPGENATSLHNKLMINNQGKQILCIMIGVSLL